MTEPASTNPKLPIWNGDWKTFTDFKLACFLELDGLKTDEQTTLAPRLARNLTGKAWEACLDIDREKLRPEKGLEYFLDFLKKKRGKQQVDVLGEAFEKYFQSAEVIRLDKENLNDYEQRLQVYFRDIQRALTEISKREGFIRNLWMASVEQAYQTGALRCGDVEVAVLVLQAGGCDEGLAENVGLDSLVHKDQERHRTTAAGRAYFGNDGDKGEDAEDTVWWADDEETSEDDETAENEVWFEEATEALQANPTEETVLANFQEAERAFYKDARKALDQSQVK